MPGNGILFVLVGPSGAGKNTLMRRVQSRVADLPQLATMTTREPRENEQEGREHWFVTKERFQHAIANDELVEWQYVHQQDLYGTPRSTIEQAIARGTDLIADIEFLGAERLVRAFPDDTVLIFVTPSDLLLLANRIRARGNVSPEELTGRLTRARFEMTYAPCCDYLVQNNDLPAAAATLQRIILTERHHRRGEPIADADLIERHEVHVRLTALLQRDADVLIRGSALPRYTLDDRYARLDKAIVDAFSREVGVPVTLIGPEDPRFDFPAPTHISVAVEPPTVMLDYFYRFAFAEPDAAPPAGWHWSPLAELGLPATLDEAIAT